MRSLLHQLENNEAVLLMYLADELPPQDRAEVEQMLATDAALRAELARVSSATERVDAAIAELDARERLPMNADAAARRVGRMAAQWHAERLAARAAARAAEPVRLVPRWAYPAAAIAACALVSLTIWWASNSDSSHRLPVAEGAPDPLVSPDGPDDEDAVAGGSGPLLFPDETPADDQTLAVGSGGGGTGIAPWADRIDALEADLYALSADVASANTFVAPEPETDGF